MSEGWVDMADNHLFYGDNLDVLRRHIPDESVDLVYLDPPFNSNANYNVLFGHADGSGAAAQIKAFDDTWHWDQAAAATFQETVAKGGPVATALASFQTLLGPSTMLAYLTMMAPRLVELHRVLKPTGSLYLHCDATASHYLKVLLDAIFGTAHFRNEIVWRRTPFSGSSKARAQQLPRSHDVILFYAKGDSWTWNAPTEPYTAEYLKRFKWDDNDGRGPYRKTLLKTYSQETYDRLAAENRLILPQKTGAHPSYKQYLSESSGQRQIDDVWTDINALNPVAKERLGYPTQKPEALLERIIRSSTNPGDVILDPFCGCGTSVAAAEKTGRRWIGIDLTALAISLIKSRLAREGVSNYTVLGEPTTADDAAELARTDPYQFQWWALGLIGARPAEQKKGADRGIDGRLFFFDGGQTPRQLIASVKAGKVSVAHVRDLRGVIEREKAELGVLISFNDSTQQMRQEAAGAGFYTSPWGQHPRIQLLTVAELLAGKRIDMPAGGAHAMQVALPPTPEPEPTIHPEQMSLGE